MSALRFSSTIVLAALSVIIADTTQAQVTLQLTTTQQTNCTAVTDAQGLRLAPGGTDLSATGVTLSGQGCGTGPVDFGAQVSAPATVTSVPATFNVTWNASANATRCVYSGSVGSATGWPIGTNACTGAACSGPHTASVTATTAGSYNFSVVCTNDTGLAQAATSVASSGGPTPNPFTLTVPATGTVGTAFQASWSVQNATSCTGSADLNGSSTTLAGWTDTTTTTSPRTITPSAAGTYTLTLTCSNPNGSATSNAATIVVSPTGGGDSCPAGRQTVCDVGYSYNLSGSNVARNVDCREANNIWGRVAPADTPVAFPWVNYFAVIANFGKTGYIGAKFHVPDTGLPTDLYGQFSHGETLPGPNLTMSISQTCGDFNPTSAICLRTNIGPGSLLTKYKVPTAPGTSCVVTPGQDYFVNIKMTDPPASHPDCSTTTCKVTVQNNHN